MPVNPNPNPPKLTPSASLLANLRSELTRLLPFSRMQPEHVDAFVAGASQRYFAPGEVLLEPSQGPVSALLCIRQGRVSGHRSLADTADSFEYGAGDLFPVGAALAGRPVTATYTANGDTFCLQLPIETVQQLVQLSPVFADFLNRRVMHMLDLSRRAMRVHWASQALAEQSLETRLGQLRPKQIVACGPAEPLQRALQQMQDRQVGSLLVVDAAGAALGILSRHDVLSRVTLPQRPLGTAIGQVMSAPVFCLTVESLLRKKTPTGDFERVQHKHSWNSDHIVGRILLFELSRHSDHHYRSNKKYPTLDSMPQSPQMPTGYPGMMVFSMFTPLFFWYMHKKLEQMEKQLA